MAIHRVVIRRLHKNGKFALKLGLAQGSDLKKGDVMSEWKRSHAVEANTRLKCIRVKFYVNPRSVNANEKSANPCGNMI
jgi:hypothetical protein